MLGIKTFWLPYGSTSLRFWSLQSSKDCVGHTVSGRTLHEVTNEDKGTPVVLYPWRYNMPLAFCLSHLCYLAVLQDIYLWRFQRSQHTPIELKNCSLLAHWTLLLPFETHLLVPGLVYRSPPGRWKNLSELPQIPFQRILTNYLTQGDKTKFLGLHELTQWARLCWHPLFRYITVTYQPHAAIPTKKITPRSDLNDRY